MFVLFFSFFNCEEGAGVIAQLGKQENLSSISKTTYKKANYSVTHLLSWNQVGWLLRLTGQPASLGYLASARLTCSGCFGIFGDSVVFWRCVCVFFKSRVWNFSLIFSLSSTVNFLMWGMAFSSGKQPATCVTEKQSRAMRIYI